MDQNRQKGFTLIELLIVVVILGILVAIAAPSMFSILEGRKLKGAAENFQVDLIFIKTEAIKRNTPVRIYYKFDSVDTSKWCYGMKVNAACDCFQADSSQADYCEIDGVKKTISQADYGNNVLIKDNNVNFASDLVSFTPLRGQATPGHVEFALADGRSIRTTVNARGRATICSDSGMGFEGC
ncbi:GspH/FimT family pseudopilin [Cycloclasticus pugetii]|jgi:type IV fimbrial biogenesis protein FimT|uniref:GspH/FimT family pseudopilin n=1 Tax=Cycloclasticus pugetii TaxID=34068 RepID=UPI000370E506|nr:GspH/FimT family pseudopilin [Cycloclasticus pugetii]